MPQLHILHAVRRGLALATTEEFDLLRACPELEDSSGRWVPRWTLEVAEALTAAGYPPVRIWGLFALGRERVFAELDALVRAGRRAAVLLSRHPYRRHTFDSLTEAAMREELRHHGTVCKPCQQGHPCFPAAQLEEELLRLFPADRRTALRDAPMAAAEGGR